MSKKSLMWGLISIAVTVIGMIVESKSSQAALEDQFDELCDKRGIERGK